MISYFVTRDKLASSYFRRKYIYAVSSVTDNFCAMTLFCRKKQV